MRNKFNWLREAAFVALGLTGGIAGCGGGSDSNTPQLTPSQPPVNTTTGQRDGTLRVLVVDPDGRPMAGAQIAIYNNRQSQQLGIEFTGTDGLANFTFLPPTVLILVNHEFGHSRSENVEVSQSGMTSKTVVVMPARPRPTVALLPTEISASSINPDRSELTLQIRVVASPSAPFVPASIGDFSPNATPLMGLELVEDLANRRRDCIVWVDRRTPVPTCNSYGDSPYTVSVPQFSYVASGAAPMPVSPASGRSTMLLMDASRRVSSLDPGAFRSFAARRFIERILTGDDSAKLAIAGLAGADGDPAEPFLLPEQPLWFPPGAGPVFVADPGLLKSGVLALEPLTGGAAPVFEGLATAFRLTAANGPAGNSSVVALLGGSDDTAMSASQREAALTSLRRQRDESGVQSILIDASSWYSEGEEQAVAELATALRAPTISLGVKFDADWPVQTWATGSHAALDLAADLLQGLPLPTLTAVFRIKARTAGTFAAGSTLRGVIYIENDSCAMGCLEIPLAFAVGVP